jgi:hypothetical protein
VARRGAVSILGGLLWGGLLYVDIGLYSDLAQKGIPGYPNSGQLELYIIFPIAMILLSACLTIFANRTPKFLFILLSLTQFALIPPYIVVWGGGV